MKISYSWLKNYIDIDLSPEKVAEILTDTGLEVEGMESFQSVKGGMQGLVIGKVMTCSKHPNADKLTLTTVDIGNHVTLPIVCGAPNVAPGQKVVVAPAGVVLHHTTGDTLEIKKAQIRGEISEGMICAEDEIGLGTSHDGIIVLDEHAVVGTPASEYFHVQTDTIFEIGLTPNRIDGGSHYGVARDLAAFLNQTRKVVLKRPDVGGFKKDNNHYPIEIVINNEEACPRYCGVTISGVTVKTSPEWLQLRLKAIGMNPINNVVDISNFVLHEIGHPLHAFDADKITGGRVVIRTVANGTKFITLDEETRTLSEEDLMICDAEKPMCIGGVFGGINSGVTENTKNIFLESAYFNPVWVRKSAKRHGLTTDASFRFERGADPNITTYVLKRTALLIKEITGGTISSDIIDVYPKPIDHFKVELSLANLKRLIGKTIEKEKVISILRSLEIEIVKDQGDIILLSVPPYRVDVKREADVIEEVLRIYGYNQVEVSPKMYSTINYVNKPDKDELINTVSNLLSANGFHEIMSNSLTRSAYYEKLEKFKEQNLVKIMNPLSVDLNSMRQTLLFNGLEAIIFNSNRQNPDLKLYEFGNCYYYSDKKKGDNPLYKYSELGKLALFVTGRLHIENWITREKETDFYYLKGYVDTILGRLGIKKSELSLTEIKDELIEGGLSYAYGNDILVELGQVDRNILKKFDIEAKVFFAELNWGIIIQLAAKHTISYQLLARFPEVKRDLSMVLNKEVRFEDIERLAFLTERNYLKQVNLFDVYEGDRIAKGKKSYAISFILQDEKETMKDKKIEKIMENLAHAFEKEINAQIRRG